MNDLTNDWLERANEEFNQKGTPADERAELAEMKWREENLDAYVAHTDVEEAFRHMEFQIAKIRSYFLTQSQKRRDVIEPQFLGIYYYLGEFWEIIVPLIAGRRSVNAFANLVAPPEYKNAISSDREVLSDFIGVFADTLDYGYAIEEVERKCPTADSKQWFRAADEHLRKAISLLFQHKASSAAIQDARMAVEMFLKADVVLKEGLTDREIQKQISHRLEVAVERCISNGLADLAPLRQKITSLPKVETRYEGATRTLGDLWASYRLALAVAMVVLRPLTGRDSRNSFIIR
jgi:hypothetical protein